MAERAKAMNPQFLKKGGKVHHKANGGEIDKEETKTTIKGDAKKFERTKVVDGDKLDKYTGTKGIKEANDGGYKKGGKVHHKAKGGTTGEKIPSDTYEKYNKGKTKFGETIEDNEGDYLETQVHGAKKDDKKHSTGGVKMGNDGGYKKGGKVHHKFAKGGHIDEPGLTKATIEGGNWENRAADDTPKGKTGTKTGEVKEGNAGGFKKGGSSKKKHFAKGGNVVDDGKAVKMPHHFVSQPVANTMQSGTFKKGGKV